MRNRTHNGHTEWKANEGPCARIESIGWRKVLLHVHFTGNAQASHPAERQEQQADNDKMTSHKTKTTAKNWTMAKDMIDVTSLKAFANSIGGRRHC